MSNYSIVTNYLSKDSLVSGNPLKLVKGADLTTEFTAVQTAVNSKPDVSTGSFTMGLNGGTTTPTVTASWVVNGSLATLLIPPITVTSNAVTAALYGLPTNLFPASTQTVSIAALVDAGVFPPGTGVQITTIGALLLFMNGSTSGFTASGTKGVASGATVSWLLGV